MRYLITVTLIDGQGTLNVWSDTEGIGRVACRVLMNSGDAEKVEMFDMNGASRSEIPSDINAKMVWSITK